MTDPLPPDCPAGIDPELWSPLSAAVKARWAADLAELRQPAHPLAKRLTEHCLGCQCELAERVSPHCLGVGGLLVRQRLAASCRACGRRWTWRPDRASAENSAGGPIDTPHDGNVV